MWENYLEKSYIYDFCTFKIILIWTKFQKYCEAVKFMLGAVTVAFLHPSLPLMQLLSSGCLTSPLSSHPMKSTLVRKVHHGMYMLQGAAPNFLSLRPSTATLHTDALLAAHLCTWHPIMCYPCRFTYPWNPFHVFTFHIFTKSQQLLSPLGAWQMTTQFLWVYLL